MPFLELSLTIFDTLLTIKNSLKPFTGLIFEFFY